MARKQAEDTRRWVVITYDDPIPTERVILPAFIFFGRAPKESRDAEWFLAAEEREPEEGRRSRRGTRELQLFALRHMRSWRPHPANVSTASASTPIAVAIAADTSAVAVVAPEGSGPGPGWDPVMPPASHDADGS